MSSSANWVTLYLRGSSSMEWRTLASEHGSVFFVPTGCENLIVSMLCTVGNARSCYIGELAR